MLITISKWKLKTTVIDKFSDRKILKLSTETKIYRRSCKQRAKISITAKFEEEILQNGNIMASQSLLILQIIVLAHNHFRLICANFAWP